MDLRRLLGWQSFLITGLTIMLIILVQGIQSSNQPQHAVLPPTTTLSHQTHQVFEQTSTIKQQVEASKLATNKPGWIATSQPLQPIVSPASPTVYTKTDKEGQELVVPKVAKVPFSVANEPKTDQLSKPSTPGSFQTDPTPTDPPTEYPDPYIDDINSLTKEAAPEIFSAPEPFQGKTIYEVKQKKPEKVIALTFDDGPWQQTSLQVLDILKENNIKATFFWIGRQVKKYPDIARKVVAEGHVIGNHTWNHQYNKVDELKAAHEINDTAALIYQTTGVKTAYFRPPGGLLNNGLVAYAQKKKYAVTMWSADSRDSNRGRPAAPALTHNVLCAARSGRIVLMHDGGGNRTQTVKALPQLIDKLQQQGYKFVTIPELLAIQETAEPPTPEAETPSPTPSQAVPEPSVN